MQSENGGTLSGATTTFLGERRATCATAKDKAAEYRRPRIFGGDDEDRTHDLRIANAALSQLSYVPTGVKL